MKPQDRLGDQPHAVILSCAELVAVSLTADPRQANLVAGKPRTATRATTWSSGKPPHATIPSALALQAQPAAHPPLQRGVAPRLLGTAVRVVAQQPLVVGRPGVLGHHVQVVSQVTPEASSMLAESGTAVGRANSPARSPGVTPAAAPTAPAGCHRSRPPAGRGPRIQRPGERRLQQRAHRPPQPLDHQLRQPRQLAKADRRAPLDGPRAERPPSRASTALDSLSPESSSSAPGLQAGRQSLPCSSFVPIQP
jgi:hypothetical protein